jgi:hypothetical protein
MATARAAPRDGEERAATNVARPSGKLWRPIARPVRTSKDVFGISAKYKSKIL